MLSTRYLTEEQYRGLQRPRKEILANNEILWGLDQHKNTRYNGLDKGENNTIHINGKTVAFLH